MSIRDKDELAAARSAGAVGGGALAGESAHIDLDADVRAYAGADIEPVARSQWALFRRRFLRHKPAVVAGVVLILLYLSAIFAGPITSRYPLNPDLGDPKVLAEANQPPSAEHWFGTDELGRDQFTRIIYAGRISLAIGLSVAIASTMVGAAIGAMAGYFGGRSDQFLMRFTDLFLVVPQLAVLLLVQKKWGGSVF